MMLRYFIVLLFALSRFTSTSLGLVCRDAKILGRLLYHAIPNKPKREDDVVYVSEEESRVITSDFRRMDEASAQYILKHMPKHSFGPTGKMRMRMLYKHAREELERDSKREGDKEEEQDDDM